VITNLENIFLQQANLLFGYLHAMLVHKLTKTDILPENLKEDQFVTTSVLNSSDRKSFLVRSYSNKLGTVIVHVHTVIKLVKKKLLI